MAPLSRTPAAHPRPMNDPTYAPLDSPPLSHTNTLVFWLLGLLNNASFVIMLACAKSISEGGTAIVFIANSIPGLCIKLTAPYWFHSVSYNRRIMICTSLMLCSFATVASFSNSNSEPTSSSMLAMQLLGVSMASAQCGLGEASLLALAGKFDSLTAFSSGTGLAGIYGFGHVYVFHTFLEWSLRWTLLLAIIYAAAYGMIYFKCLWQASEISPSIPVVTEGEEVELTLSEAGSPPEADAEEDEAESFDDDESQSANNISIITTRQRLSFVLGLWPYMIPLFVVYMAEYILQAGVWTAIGFPLSSEAARARFYQESNWMYQVGVFLSRSSGNFFTVSMTILWIMPLLQCVNVGFFWWIAQTQPLAFYNELLLIPCLYVGLLGGGVYIHGFRRLSLDSAGSEREFALSATSVASDVGILTANVLSLLVQACLYQHHGIDGATMTCPVAELVL